MFCPKCGKEIPEGGVCTCQGNENQNNENHVNNSQLYGNQPYGNQAYGNQAYGNQAYGNQPYGMPIMNPVGNAGYTPEKMTAANAAIKRVCGSPMVIVLAIIETISVLMTLFGNFISGGQTSEIIIGTIIGLVPSFFLISGLYLIYADGVSQNKMRTIGFTFIRGYLITMEVMLIIIVAVLAFVVLFIVGSGESIKDFIINSYGSSAYYGSGLDQFGSTLNTIYIFAFSIVMVILILFIVFYVKIASSLKSIKNIITYRVKGRVSMFAAVMFFIFAAAMFITLIYSLGNGDIYTAVTALFKVIVYILSGVLFINGRKQINNALGLY